MAEEIKRGPGRPTDKRKDTILSLQSTVALLIYLSLSLISFVQRFLSGLSKRKMFFLMHSSRRLLSISSKSVEIRKLALTLKMQTWKIKSTLSN